MKLPAVERKVHHTRVLKEVGRVSALTSHRVPFRCDATELPVSYFRTQTPADDVY